MSFFQNLRQAAGFAQGMTENRNSGESTCKKRLVVSRERLSYGIVDQYRA